MLQSTEKSLRDYFLGELDHLRSRSADFAHDYPKVAAELELSRGKSADPHIEALLQSVAYLTGHIQYQLDKEAPEISNTLLNILYPHLEKPIPSMAIAKIDVKPNGANFANGYILKKHRIAAVEAMGTAGSRPVCKFRTCFDTPLWPLKVTFAGEHPTNYYDFLSDNRKVISVLRLQISNTGNESFHSYPLSNLRFYINGDDHQAFALYRLLREHLHSIALVSDENSPPVFLPKTALNFLGFNDEHALFPYSSASHPAYRILQEYFSFPEKHLFFEVDHLDRLEKSQSFEILFLLEAPIGKTLKIDTGNFLLNCVPLINLFPLYIDPVRLDHRDFEYRLIPGQEQYRYCEIYSIDEMTSTRPSGKPRKLKSYFGLNSDEEIIEDHFYWTSRREISHLKSLSGTEMYVSFHDRNFDVHRLVEESISARVTCTNRNLAEKMRAGDRLHLEGVGPVSAIELVTKPTRHEVPSMNGMKPWRLVSHLCLNHLSLSSGSESLQALKCILMLYASTSNPINKRQIDSLCHMQCRQVVRRISNDAWRGFCRGTEIQLTIDESLFEGGSSLLFGEILNRFFALYTSINAFTQLVLESKQKKGNWRTWQPMVGEQAVL